MTIDSRIGERNGLFYVGSQIQSVEKLAGTFFPASFLIAAKRHFGLFHRFT
jgi:hypothetical protein